MAAMAISFAFCSLQHHSPQEGENCQAFGLEGSSQFLINAKLLSPETLASAASTRLVEGADANLHLGHPDSLRQILLSEEEVIKKPTNNCGKQQYAQYPPGEHVKSGSSVFSATIQETSPRLRDSLNFEFEVSGIASKY
jgi:hypothetical protein